MGEYHYILFKKIKAQRVNNIMDEDTDRGVHSMSMNRLLASSGIRP